MFLFVLRYLGFLKSIPLVPLVFDSLLRVITMITHRSILVYVDDIEAEVSRWDGIRTTLHKYGGLQFNYQSTELGHIHGNGLLDMLLNKRTKVELLKEGRIQDHHSFINSGWISFYIKTEDDKRYAIQLLALAYRHKNQR
jgi:hypothetical protein